METVDSWCGCATPYVTPLGLITRSVVHALGLITRRVMATIKVAITRRVISSLEQQITQRIQATLLQIFKVIADVGWIDGVVLLHDFILDVPG